MDEKNLVDFSKVSVDELHVINLIKQQHRPYYEAMLYSARVIVSRNKKYTGNDAQRDLFANFKLDAKIQGIAPSQAFKQWIAKKVARIMINTDDFEDESFTDSLRDLANYTLLWIGYIVSQEGKKEYIREFN